MSRPLAIAAVIGQNVKRIRGAHRLEDVSIVARATGLKWDPSRVSAVERGEISPTLPTLLALCLTLSEVTNKPVALADLVSSDSDIQVTSKLVMPGTAVAAALRGEPADQRGADLKSAVLSLSVRQAGGLAEQRAAQSLGISGGRFIALCRELWDGRTFAEERDRRAGKDANAQARGQVSRAMKAELKLRLERGDD